MDEASVISHNNVTINEVDNVLTIRYNTLNVLYIV